MQNFEFEIASDFVNLTNTPIFLTGNAGTGKTTFLRQVIGSTAKRCVVVAPTGVAAINAGGVTIHSMFGLPTRTCIPSNDYIDPNLGNNRPMLSKHFHYHRDKLKVFQELETLVIDEVSMVRADLLDAVDFALQYVRRSSLPFGGVQPIFIGDMYQLPPVVKDDEWPLLSQYYASPFFFDSLAFKSLDPVYVELKKIYRQTDRTFINILNNIRHQDFQQEDYETLKEHYKPEFRPEEPGFITLTTHNKKAEEINENELRNLPGEEVIFDAEVSGDFFENMYPTENLLRLKIGAQVMFVKNDTSGERRYFNGKIGIVESIDPYAVEDEKLVVRFPDTDELITVSKEVWENIRYSMNAEENKLEQNRVGSFTQYPLRLAWAITIHKSQGLTFEKAVIDAGESFAAGQVYVALSRCTGMENLVLKSLITNRSIISDPRIVDFSQRIMRENVLENKLEASKKLYAFQQLTAVFQFDKLKSYVAQWDKEISKLKSIERSASFKMVSTANKNLDVLQQVANKFQHQLLEIFNSSNSEDERMAQLEVRCVKAIGYFTSTFYDSILKIWEADLADKKMKSKMKKYASVTSEVVNVFWNKMNQMYKARLGELPIWTGDWITSDVKVKVGKKLQKGDTYRETLELFKQGKSIEEIAAMRDMTTGTIESHLGKWLITGDLHLDDLMPRERQDAIKLAMNSTKEDSLGAIKAKLGDAYSFSEIRWMKQAVLAENIAGSVA